MGGSQIIFLVSQCRSNEVMADENCHERQIIVSSHLYRRYCHKKGQLHSVYMVQLNDPDGTFVPLCLPQLAYLGQLSILEAPCTGE